MPPFLFGWAGSCSYPFFVPRVDPGSVLTGKTFVRNVLDCSNVIYALGHESVALVIEEIVPCSVFTDKVTFAKADQFAYGLDANGFIAGAVFVIQVIPAVAFLNVRNFGKGSGGKKN